MDLKGFEVYGRENYNLYCESGSDDIIILRRVDAGSTSVSYTSKLIPRKLSEAEMIQRTRSGPATSIGEGIDYWIDAETDGTTIFLQNMS